MAYLDREHDAALAGVRGPLAARTGRPVTFGWGPRFLHSTGQYHKGGPADRELPADHRGRRRRTSRSRTGPSRSGSCIAAQAAGDAQVLAEHGRPVLRLNLRDRAAGLRRLQQVLGAHGETGPGEGAGA